jgi:REP element-mobilizing transposase RayT
MARAPRGEVIDPGEINIVHCINRTVRRCFLLGNDAFTGKNFDHRKVWIEELLVHFSAHFGIELIAYSILSNHYHLILRNRPDVVADWDDTEVARRWLMICPPARCKGKPAEPTEAELNAIRRCPRKLAAIRKRLSDISWWMRLLNQRIAQRANREEEESGRFWQDRYRAIRLLDEEALISCMAYVELNPLRAGLAERIEDSPHTSIQRRIEGARSQPPRDSGGRRDAFLAELTLGRADASSDQPSGDNGSRCSNRGVLPMSLESYLELLDWTARHVAPGKAGITPKKTPPVLQRIGLEPENWIELVECFDQSFYLIAGCPHRMEATRGHLTQRRFRVRPRARGLLTVAVA